MRLKRRPGAVTLHSLGCGMAKPHSILPMRLHCIPLTAVAGTRISYLQKEASALYQQGDELGDNDALFSAIERYQRLVHLMPRERMPLQWASAQNDLGNALLSLGQRESGVARLDQAIAAYFDALKEWTEDRAPLDWAILKTIWASRIGPSASVRAERCG